MKKEIQIGEVFKLADLIPYQDGKITNMSLIRRTGMKFMMMSFDAGTGLPEHTAPGDALIFALDGEAILYYEGKEHTVKAGENFYIAKDVKHWLKAEKRFKMALLLMLDE
jgi:quercetin dioxygenase-like cupin family protein